LREVVNKKFRTMGLLEVFNSLWIISYTIQRRHNIVSNTIKSGNSYDRFRKYRRLSARNAL
jgi:hypothetical protein